MTTPVESIAFGTCACGTAGQLFRTGKCAHCYIADLESAASAAKPTIYGLMNKNGVFHMSENCIAFSADELDTELEYLDDADESAGWRIVPLYEAPLSETPRSEPFVLRDAAQRMADAVGAHDNQNMPWSVVLSARENLLSALKGLPSVESAGLRKDDPK